MPLLFSLFSFKICNWFLFSFILFYWLLILPIFAWKSPLLAGWGRRFELVIFGTLVLFWLVLPLRRLVGIIFLFENEFLLLLKCYLEFVRNGSFFRWSFEFIFTEDGSRLCRSIYRIDCFLDEENVSFFPDRLLFTVCVKFLIFLAYFLFSDTDFALEFRGKLLADFVTLYDDIDFFLLESFDFWLLNQRAGVARVRGAELVGIAVVRVILACEVKTIKK